MITLRFITARLGASHRPSGAVLEIKINQGILNHVFYKKY